MKPNSFSLKTFVKLLFFIAIIVLLGACKKDQLTVNQDKEFVEVGYVKQPNNSFDNPFTLTLMTDGKADILPGGDIVSRGTYKISGKNLTVKADNETFKFDIISETEIKIKGSETLLRLH